MDGLAEGAGDIVAPVPLPASVAQKMASACLGAVLTSLVVTPFDVVKTRLQAGRAVAGGGGYGHLQVHECCREVFFGQPVVCRFPAPAVALDGAACAGSIAVGAEAASARLFTGTLEGMVKIVRYEGVQSLWSGLSPTLLMQAPATVGYYLGYEFIRDRLVARFRGTGIDPDHYAPLVAGSFARTIAATAISPIELIRTRVQSSSQPLRSVLAGVRAEAALNGPRWLWTGLAPTLWRDVPFSAIYWFGYERTKRYLLGLPAYQRGGVWGEGWASFLAGAASGSLAAVVTTPFDVAKTRNQIGEGPQPGMVAIMRAIVAAEGWAGLMAGWTARVAKVAPACAIMISTYEVGKRMAGGLP
ncbi:putative mitochondrial carrier protein [Hyaloraphidium curvatum]|nr:putative mitochondrial carrier protein [Hyaloraphidium curvatum]